MKPVKAQSCRQAELKALRHWLEQQPNRVRPRRKPRLKNLQADGCLLLTRNSSSGSGSLQGTVGLDLDSAEISLLACRGPGNVPALLDAAERLAVSFGLLELVLRTDPQKKNTLPLPRQWLTQTEPGLWRRRLSRRLTQAARKALRMNEKLGVPANYGCIHRLPLQYEPAQLASIGQDVFDREQFMLPRAANSLLDMIRQAAAMGVVIQPVSAFRSVDYQCQLLQNKLDKGQVMADILQVSAAPGYSEHHSGRAVDLTTPGFKPLEEEFAESEAFSWLRKYAGDFGFRLSYPRGNRHGVAYEPWHWYYTG